MLSKIEYCRLAQTIPIGTPSKTANNIAVNARRTVAPARDNISLVTGLFVIYEFPKSKRKTIFLIYLPYCTRKGSFSPISSRSSLTADSGAEGPSALRAGSPGVRYRSPNTMKLTPIITGIR